MIPESVKARIEKDAEVFMDANSDFYELKRNGRAEGYISGATAEYERAQPVIDALIEARKVIEKCSPKPEGVLSIIRQALKKYENGV